MVYDTDIGVEDWSLVEVVTAVDKLDKGDAIEIFALYMLNVVYVLVGMAVTVTVEENIFLVESNVDEECAGVDPQGALVVLDILSVITVCVNAE